jgi:hypothetical protein
MRMSFNLKPTVFLVHILTSVVFELEHPHQNQSQKGKHSYFEGNSIEPSFSFFLSFTANHISIFQLDVSFT